MEMHTYKPVLGIMALVATCAFVGTYGSQYRAQLTHQECVGKMYGTQGCPLKQVSNSCGDGRVDAGEECDNGAARNGDGNCSAECLFLACGDGIVSDDLGEECEPTREEVYAIDPANGELTTELRFMAAACGTTCTVPDCDDDGACSGGCRRQQKSACAASSSSVRPAAPALASQNSKGDRKSSASSVYIARCGNKQKDPGEQCDDGNGIDTDSCTIACKLPRCGDGSVQQDETCDDGNRIDNDRCTNLCALPACGDAIVQKGEQCDNGGNNSDFLSNACRGDCMAPRCGDNVTDNGEECDGGESCTAECARIKTFGSFLADTPGAGKAAIALSIFGGLLVLAFLFRVVVHRFVGHVAGEQVARSIDDIPLDEIEMPWMKW